MASKQTTNDNLSEIAAADQKPIVAVKKRPRKRVEKSTDLPNDTPAEEQKAGLAQAILAAYNASNQQQSQPETPSAQEVAEPIVEEASEEPKPKAVKAKKSSTKSEAESSKVKSKTEKPKKKCEEEKISVPKPDIAAPIEEQATKPKQAVEKTDEQKPEKKKRSLSDNDNEPPAKKKKPSVASGKSKKKLEEVATPESTEGPKQSNETSPSDEPTEKKVDLDQLTPAKRKRLENREKRKRVKEEAKNFALPKGLSNNLSILIRHHGKISFAKPVVLEWAPLPVIKSKSENSDENEEELIAAPTKEPTEQYQYLRIPASQDYEINPLGCQLINLNFGLQFADKEFTQLCKWSVHNWEPLLSEGLVMHYAEPIQQNIQLLVQNCGDRKIVIKQGEPLAVIRFHPLPKRITLRYVDNVQQ